jgi:DNA-binding PadR family transcriptional regulator
VAFEIQELHDVIRVIVLLNLSKGYAMPKVSLKRRIDKVCVNLTCIHISELDKALNEMAAQGLIINNGDTVQLTEQGLKLGKEWQSLLLKKEPILEVVAGLVDGSITGLVVILSAFISTLTGNTAFFSANTVVFAAFLTLTAVAITNFSSFFLGGITEDLSDIITLQTLMNYSLSDSRQGGTRQIPDACQKTVPSVRQGDTQIKSYRSNHLRNHHFPCWKHTHNHLRYPAKPIKHNPIFN